MQMKVSQLPFWHNFHAILPIPFRVKVAKAHFTLYLRKPVCFFLWEQNHQQKLASQLH
jgi:hypothetical protein